MAEIKRIDTNKTGCLCMHCGKWLGLTHHMNDGRRSYSLVVNRRKLGMAEGGVICMGGTQIDEYLLCDECFSVLDLWMGQEFILYPKDSNILIKKED